MRQQHPGGTIIWKNVSLTCITIIDPVIGWLEIFDIPTFDLNAVTSVNDEYMDKSSARVRQLFNNT